MKWRKLKMLGLEMRSIKDKLRKEHEYSKANYPLYNFAYDCLCIGIDDKESIDEEIIDRVYKNGYRKGEKQKWRWDKS